MYSLKEVSTYDKYSYGKPEVVAFTKDAHLHIGKFCSIAGGVTVLLTAEHRPDWITTFPFPVKWKAPEIKGHPWTKGNVIVGNDVWIGWGATLMSGITIRSGAVIGAYSVVTKDVEPYNIVAGNPAKMIKKRFDDNIIAALLRLQWWDWPEEKIRTNIDLLCSNNVRDFLEQNYG